MVASGRSWLALLVLIMAAAPAALGAHNNRKMLDINLGGECMEGRSLIGRRTVQKLTLRTRVPAGTSSSAKSLFLDWGRGVRRALSGTDCDAAASASAEAGSLSDAFFGSAASRAAAQARAEASGFTGWPWRGFRSDCRARASAYADSATFGDGASFASR